MKKNKFYIIIIIVVMCAAIFSLIWYAKTNDETRMKSSDSSKIIYSKTEQDFIKNNKESVLSLNKNILYMNHNGFMEKYFNKIYDESGARIKISNKNNDGKIVIVNSQNRDELNKYNISKPIFQMEGHLYERADSSKKNKKEYIAVGVKGDLTKTKIKKLQYNGKNIKFIEEKTHTAAVKKALEIKADFIIGEKNIIDSLVDKKYEDTTIKVFESNVCVITKNSDKVFFDVINVLIQKNANERNVISANNAVGTNYSVFFKEKNLSYSFVIISIMFLTVFGGFLIYYMTTKNLYEELTARKEQLDESKTEMETTFNSVPFYMAELDMDGNILAINNSLREYLRRGNIVIQGKSIVDVFDFSNEGKEKIKTSINMIRKQKKWSKFFVKSKRQIFDIDIYPIESQRKDGKKILFIADDVTSVKTAEKQMLQQNKMIAVGQLAAGVAHEIRNPLGIIRNYCYVLKTTAGNNEEQKAKAVEVIEKAVESSGKIITNLLNFSRISSGEKENINIISHIDSLISINQGLLKKKKINVNVHAKEDYLINIRKESFDMILINLLSNAVDAIDKDIDGKIDIDIKKEKDYLYIDFYDNGSGMDKETIVNIFNPFYTTKINEGGNGLGLYIVYNEIEKMNGTITVQSEIGIGTEFKIAIPTDRKEPVK